mgnify:CR=1 FL=1
MGAYLGVYIVRSHGGVSKSVYGPYLGIFLTLISRCQNLALLVKMSYTAMSSPQYLIIMMNDESFPYCACTHHLYVYVLLRKNFEQSDFR